MGKTLFTKTKNKGFKDVTPEGFSAVFQKVLAEQKATLNNSALITSYYETHDYDPVLLMEHLPNDDVKNVAAYFQKAGEHGLDPKIFNTDKIQAELNKFYNKKGIKTLDEAYHDMANLELLMAFAYWDTARTQRTEKVPVLGIQPLLPALNHCPSVLSASFGFCVEDQYQPEVKLPLSS